MYMTYDLTKAGQSDHQNEDYAACSTDIPLSIDIMKTKRRIGVVLVILILVTAWVWGIPAYMIRGDNEPIFDDISSSCDSVDHGYRCSSRISHYWGQYSPWFSVPSEIPTDIPAKCEVTFAQVLSRHGARDPTKHRSFTYRKTIQRLRSNVKKFSGKYAFLAKYKYTLGADELTLFGEREMVASGIHFYRRYRQLAESRIPFVRSGSQNRVLVSARKWMEGFHLAKLAREYNDRGDPTYPYNVVVLSEADGFNNTLSHGLCSNFESGPFRELKSKAKAKWTDIFIPPILARLSEDLPGANLTTEDVIVLMDLCPFETVASSKGHISAFCSLFTEKEWHQYNYYQTIGKYYGYSYGNPLGPTQGVGFANELIARLTRQPVQDHTSTNRTLDTNPTTFPLDSHLYADFSHDNDMITIFAALGLYHSTAPLPNTTIVEAGQAGGYSVAWTVPFGARAYFEKMRCQGHDEEFVRVLINDRVLPLEQCHGDHLGRCKLDDFINSLSYAAGGGDWDECFV